MQAYVNTCINTCKLLLNYGTTIVPINLQIEFAVQMTCQNCVDSIRNVLLKVDGINNVQISLDQNSVIVDTNLSHLKIQEIIEDTGRKAVLKGYGGRLIKNAQIYFKVK
jgi:copper chaperone CopZ